MPVVLLLAIFLAGCLSSPDEPEDPPEDDTRTAASRAREDDPRCPGGGTWTVFVSGEACEYADLLPPKP